jgi:hypothetical protein
MGRLTPPFVASLIFSIAACVNGSSSFGQTAGSTGGTIGKHDKSVSGEEDIRKKVRHGSVRGANPSNRASSIPSGRGSVALYNGTWSGVSTGHCIAGWSWTLQVSNGIISGRATSGRVSGGGAIGGAMEVVGTTYNFVGHMHRDEASGTWKSRPGCFGTWTATRS